MLEGEDTSVADLQHATVTARNTCVVVNVEIYNSIEKKSQGKKFLTPCRNSG